MKKRTSVILKDILLPKGYIRGPFGSSLKRGDMLDTGIPVYEQQHAIYNMRDFRFYISNEKFETMKRFAVQPDDLIISCSGTVGKVSRIRENDPRGIISQALLLLRVDQSIIDVDYLRYFFLSREGYNAIVSRSSGSVQVNISKREVIEQIPLQLPGLDEQKKIVAILNAIDEKIETNQKINNNLQQQAFAIFDRLLSNKHSSECCLSQIAIINPKRILKKNEPARCIDMAQLSTSGTFPNGWEVKPYNGGMRFSNGDTLLARITPCLENGKAAYIDFLNKNEVAFGSTEYVVIASQGDYPSEFFYCLARYPAFVDYAVKNMNGSSGRQVFQQKLLETLCSQY